MWSSYGFFLFQVSQKHSLPLAVTQTPLGETLSDASLPLRCRSQPSAEVDGVYLWWVTSALILARARVRSSISHRVISDGIHSLFNDSLLPAPERVVKRPARKEVPLYCALIKIQGGGTRVRSRGKPWADGLDLFLWVWRQRSFPLCFFPYTELCHLSWKETKYFFNLLLCSLAQRPKKTPNIPFRRQPSFLGLRFGANTIAACRILKVRYCEISSFIQGPDLPYLILFLSSTYWPQEHILFFTL